MAVISISDQPDDIWKVAGWVFRQLLDDVVAHYPEDVEMAEKFKQSKALRGLILELLPREFAARITNAILKVTTGILSGTVRSGIVDQSYGDDQTIQQYRESIKELAGIVRRSIESRSG
jgi:hypothetical protein